LKVISEFTGKEYETDDCIVYGNATQAAQYWLWGIKPVDFYPTEERRFVFVFTKEDHKKLINKWKGLI
jgi:hypothetical protein